MGQDDTQKISRRCMVACLGTVLLAGCSGSKTVTARPTPKWPGYPAPPTPGRHHSTVQPPYPQPTRSGTSTTTASNGGIKAISRSQWARSGPISSKVNAMNGVNKITVHHEGWKAVDFTDRPTTQARIETIRSVHTRDRGWGDIGYHYIIDRAGRVWQGRPIQYQGAHVSQNNEHNLGILVLGNFDKQSPSSAQINALFNTTASLARTYKVKSALVRSHREIKPTSCPGRNLQRQMDALRQRCS